MNNCRFRLTGRIHVNQPQELFLLKLAFLFCSGTGAFSLMIFCPGGRGFASLKTIIFLKAQNRLTAHLLYQNNVRDQMHMQENPQNSFLRKWPYNFFCKGEAVRSRLNCCLIFYVLITCIWSLYLPYPIKEQIFNHWHSIAIEAKSRKQKRKD